MSSFTFTPGWELEPSARYYACNVRQPRQSIFAPKVANNSMNSFHIVTAAYGQPAYLQVKSTRVADIYENTGVTSNFQMPNKGGRKVDLTFYGLGKVENQVTQDITKEYYAPVGCSISYWIPEVQLGPDMLINDLLGDVFTQCLLGALVSVDDSAHTYLNFMQVLKGVLNLPSIMSDEPKT